MDYHDSVKKEFAFLLLFTMTFFLSLLKCSSNFPEVNKKTSPQESQKPFALFPNLTYPVWQFSEPRGCQHLGKHSAAFKAEIFLASRGPVGKLNYNNKTVAVTASSP